MYQLLQLDVLLLTILIVALTKAQYYSQNSNLSSTTTSQPSTARTRPSGNLPQDFLSRKIIYQCSYFNNMTADCLTVQKCTSDFDLTFRPIEASNFSFNPFDCTGVLSIVTWSFDDGLLRPQLFDYVKNDKSPIQNKPPFACAFYTQDPPAGSSSASVTQQPPAKLQQFECFSTEGCSDIGRNGMVNCTGGVPWFGNWSSQSQIPTDLRGNITAAATA